MFKDRKTWFLLVYWVAKKKIKRMKKNLEAVVRRCSVKKGSNKFRKIHRKAPALGSLFIRVTDLSAFM